MPRLTTSGEVIANPWPARLMVLPAATLVVGWLLNVLVGAIDGVTVNGVEVVT